MIDLDNLPSSAVAAEIGARFDVLMKRGGRIDQILAGGAGPRAPSLPEVEADRLLRNLETQLAEYREAITAAALWMRDWLRRQGPKGFRCTRPRPPAPDPDTSHVKHEAAAE